ncbi:MAG: protein kinase [Reyranellaceae bacterium]
MTPASDNPQALPPGHLLSEYRIERVLGSGGFGITYLAEDVTLHKKLAIKEYLPVDFALRLSPPAVAARSRGAEDDFRWGLERFLDEARTLARFRHPHLVPVLRYFEANGTAYMVMEYEQGDTLADLVGELEQAYDEAGARALLTPLLDGLDVVHRAGFLHRDIKPGNIVLRSGGQPVLIDFGAARQALGGRSRSMTNIVTPRFAPIEQYGIDQRQGPWSDIYGLAAVMHTVIAGEPPPDAVSRLPEDPYRRLAERRPAGFSQGFLAAIDWGLEIFPADRPQSIDEWRAALDGRIAAPLPQSALTRRVGDTGAAQAAATSRPVAAATAIERPAPPSIAASERPAPAWLLPAAVVAVLAIVGVGWLIERDVVPRAAQQSAAQPPSAPPATPPTPSTAAPARSEPPKSAAAKPAAKPDTSKPDSSKPASSNPEPAKPPAAEAKPADDKVSIVQAQGIEAADAARARAREAEIMAQNVRRVAGEATALAERARLRAAEAASVTSLALAAVDLPDGGRYAGELNAGAKHGLGVLISPDGKRYAGQWSADWPDGRGVMTYADGRRYEGELHAGKRHGLGVLVYGDGRRLEGQWNEDRVAGLALSTAEDGTTMAGQWRDNGLQGLGAARFADGSRYEGEWRAGRRSGYGVLTAADGGATAGRWQDDQAVAAP